MNLSIVQTRMIEICEKLCAFEQEKSVLSKELLDLRTESGQLQSSRAKVASLQQQIVAFKTEVANKFL